MDKAPTPTPKLTCEVCGQHEAVGVASCSFGAMSLAYCQQCLDQKAEPLWGFDYMFTDVSDNGEGLADWWSKMTTWKDGSYLSWPDYVTLRRDAKATGQ